MDKIKYSAVFEFCSDLKTFIPGKQFSSNYNYFTDLPKIH